MDFIEPGYKYRAGRQSDQNLTRTPETELRAYIFHRNVLAKATDNFSFFSERCE